MWRFVSEAFSWPVVEAVLGQGYLIVGHFFELAVLGKELAQQAVEVFVGAAFPGGVRMGKCFLESFTGVNRTLRAGSSCAQQNAASGTNRSRDHGAWSPFDSLQILVVRGGRATARLN